MLFYKLSILAINFLHGLYECILETGGNTDFGKCVLSKFSSILEEDEFHRLADATIHDLQGKVEVIIVIEFTTAT